MAQNSLKLGFFKKCIYTLAAMWVKASDSNKPPYIVNPYGFYGLEIEISDSEEKQFYRPYNISGYNCEVTAYNYGRFAYSSMVKGKYNADTNTYNIPDLGDDYEYYKNILKPQKVSTFMNTFTSFKYEDLERLGQFLEESVDLLQGDIWFDEMHWSDEKKTAIFDISQQDDAIILLFPRGNNYILIYNIFQSIVKPIVKLMSKKLSKKLDSEVILPVLIGGMASDIDYIDEVECTLADPNLRAHEKIEKITSLTWTKFFKALDKQFQGDIDSAIKESFTEFVDDTVDKVGGYDAALDWKVVKKAFKQLEWVKKIGDLVTGTLGTFKEDNAVYPIYWEARGQFVLAQSEATVGEGESIKVRVIVGSNSYRCESSDEKIATVKSNHDKIEITGVDAGRTIITVRDIIAQKTEKITVDVTGIQTFALASSSVSVPVYEDRSVAIERGDGPFHIFGGDEKIAIAKISNKAVVVSGVSEGSTTFQVYNGATNQFLPLMVKVTAETVAITDERIVDLGLSVNWANCNVGANEPQEYGDYFAWGEVDSKDYFSANNYKYYSNGKFVDIGSDISGTKYDAATHNMGDYWRMPTKAEYEELISKCEWKFITYRKERGWRVTGSNGNSIFLPAAGSILYDWNEDASIDGFYWSSNITDNHREVYTLFSTMHDYKIISSYMNCFEGRSIRAVTENNTPQGSLQLSTTTLTLTTGHQGTVEVTSGSGSYDAVSNAKDVATVTVDGAKLTIKAVASGSATITVKDNQTQERAKINVTVTEADTQVYLTCPDDNHPHIIHMGIAGKWACCNVGAEKPEDYGCYYAWGETEEKDYYDWNSYIHCDGSSETCHNLGEDISGTQYDVAHVKWGGEWCMPSVNQFELLDEYSKKEYTKVNGKKGYKYTSATGGSIFIPDAGTREKDKVKYAEQQGYYWLSNDCGDEKSKAYYAYGHSTAGGGISTGDRCEGKPIRPIIAYQDNNISCPDDNHPHIIDMGIAGKWACCNVGASTPWEIGNHYSWGNTDETDCSIYDINIDITGTKYDIAHVKWGGDWCMPSFDQLKLLRNSCINTKKTINGVNGIIFTAPNGNSIFLPAAGTRWDNKVHYVGDEGNYWSTTVRSTDGCPYYLHIYGSGAHTTFYGNWRGNEYSVRPIQLNR